MNTTNNELPVGLAPLKTLELALQKATVGGKNQIDADFREAFPLIEQYLATNVSQKEARNLFNDAYGHNLQRYSKIEPSSLSRETVSRFAWLSMTFRRLLTSQATARRPTARHFLKSSSSIQIGR